MTMDRLLPLRRPDPEAGVFWDGAPAFGPQKPEFYREPAAFDFTVGSVKDAFDLRAELRRRMIMFGYGKAKISYAPGCEHLRLLVGALAEGLGG